MCSLRLLATPDIFKITPSSLRQRLFQFAGLLTEIRDGRSARGLEPLVLFRSVLCIRGYEFLVYERLVCEIGEGMLTAFAGDTVQEHSIVKGPAHVDHCIVRSRRRPEWWRVIAFGKTDRRNLEKIQHSSRFEVAKLPVPPIWSLTLVFQVNEDE